MDIARFVSITELMTGGLNITETIKTSPLAVNLMLFLLIVMSIISWGLIAYKFILYRKATLETEKFVSIFWKNMNSEEIFSKSNKMKFSPVAQVFCSGYQEFKDTKESWENKGIAVIGTKVEELAANVERAMKRENQSRTQILESRLTFLATTATASPFIGLFGTVYGIMDAFQEIGKTGNATLGSIAPHLSDALVTTAFGLIAAIPAAVFFNYFNSQLQRFENEALNVAIDFINQIKRSNV
ncbi:MotA/TolQ/ExbB proton channel family protein [bacterium]|nr:MotA/TolQ/ExbB proton channel family protein [bacterium]